MKKTYRTAMGKQIDIDSIRVANEQTIAVGNMKVNARGDTLGPGGAIVQGRNAAMTEHYKVYGTAAAVPNDIPSPATVAKQSGTTGELVADDLGDGSEFEDHEEPDTPATNLRGSLASSVGKK